MLGVESNSQGFDVKLPPNFTLTETVQCMKDLDKILSQCPLFPDDEQIQLKGLNLGSSWLIFSIIGGTPRTIKAIADLVDSAIIIRSHYLTCKQQEKNARTFRLSNDLIESLSKVHNAMLNSTLETVTKNLSDSYNIENPEDSERLKLSLKMLSDLMSPGMEIYAGINTPAETKALFPPVATQKLATNATGLLSEKSTEDSDDPES